MTRIREEDCCRAREVTLSFMDTLIALTHLLTYLQTLHDVISIARQKLHENVSRESRDPVLHLVHVISTKAFASQDCYGQC